VRKQCRSLPLATARHRVICKNGCEAGSIACPLRAAPSSMPKTESCGRPIADEGRRMAQGRVSSTGKQQSCRIDCEVARSLTKDHEWRRGESLVPENSRAAESIARSPDR